MTDPPYPEIDRPKVIAEGLVPLLVVRREKENAGVVVNLLIRMVIRTVNGEPQAARNH